MAFKQFSLANYVNLVINLVKVNTESICNLHIYALVFLFGMLHAKFQLSSDWILEILNVFTVYGQLHMVANLVV